MRADLGPKEGTPSTRLVKKARSAGKDLDGVPEGMAEQAKPAEMSNERRERKTHTQWPPKLYLGGESKSKGKVPEEARMTQ